MAFAGHPLQQLVLAIAQTNNNNIFPQLLIFVLQHFHRTNRGEELFSVEQFELVLEMLVGRGVVVIEFEGVGGGEEELPSFVVLFLGFDGLEVECLGEVVVIAVEEGSMIQLHLIYKLPARG